MVSANVQLGRLQSASSAKAVASASQHRRSPALTLTTFCVLICVTSMRRGVLKEVCQLVAESVELKPPQYISFDCYQMDHNGLSLRVTKGKGDEQTCEKI